MNAVKALKPLLIQSFAFAPRKLLACLMLMLLGSIVSGGGILLIIPMLAFAGIDIASIGSNKSFIDGIGDFLSPFNFSPSLSLVLILYLLVVLAVSCLAFYRDVLSASIQQSFVMHLRNRLSDRLFSTRWRHINDAHMADFLRLLTSQVQVVGSIISLLLKLSSSIILMIVYLLISAALSIKLMAIALLLGACMFMVVWPLNTRLRSSGRRMLGANVDMHRDIFDDLANLKVIKGFAAEPLYLEKIRANNDILEKQKIYAARINALTRTINLLGAAVVFSIVFYAAISWLRLPIANVLIVLLIFARLMPHVVSSQSAMQSIIHHAPVFQDLLNHSAELRAKAEPPHVQSESLGLKHGLELREVTYQHLGAELPAISDLSFSLKRNHTLAITGPSGAGKSTLADLLSGLLEPTKGEILIDGCEINDKNRRAWRQRVAYVTQDVFLFHDSIRANLCWVTEEHPNDDELWEVLNLAAADDFVKKLPHGLDTRVGDRGVRLSGGERQRLTLARALLSRPDLLILDEATSALDQESELKIKDALSNLDGHMTIIIIAHNETTIEHVSQRITLA